MERAACICVKLNVFGLSDEIFVGERNALPRRCHRCISILHASSRTTLSWRDGTAAAYLEGETEKTLLEKLCAVNSITCGQGWASSRHFVHLSARR